MREWLAAALAASCVLVVTRPVLSQPSENQKQTIAILEQGVKEHPDNAELWVHLGFEYRKIEDVDKSQKAFEQATRLDPTAAEAFYMLGLIYEKKGLAAQAKDAWKSCADAASEPGMRQTACNHLHVLGAPQLAVCKAGKKG